MNLLGRFRKKAATIAPVQPAAPVQSISPKDDRQAATNAEMMLAMLSGSRSISGANVTAESALTFSAVLACVRVLAESVAMIPYLVYERIGHGKERAASHSLYSVLHDAPNSEMTSFQWRETSMAHDVLWGNCYSEIVADGAGRVRELWPLLPQHMTPDRVNGKMIYKYRDPIKGPIIYQASEIFHVPGLSMNGLIGLSMIGIYRESIGLGLTLNEHGSRLFSNGARAGGVLKNPGTLSQPAYDRLKGSFDATYAGVENAGRTILLEEGTDFVPTTMPSDDAQFLESRIFQIEEVARMMHVPQHMIGSLEHATFSNIEHLSLDYVIYSLTPWLTRWEQTSSLKLLLPDERARYFTEFLVDGLLRGDLLSRYQAYNSSINAGWMTRNEARQRENMNPDDPALDKYLVPLNMTTTDAAAQQVTP